MNCGIFWQVFFAPIAFFWLVLGYIQQGKQLDQNTKTLQQQEKAFQLQFDELRESVKQQKEIALINAKTLQSSYEKERPEISYWFPISYKHGNSYTLLLKIHNIGKGDFYNIEVKVKNKKSTRDLKKFLKVRDSISICLILLDESTVEVFDETLGSLNKNTFMAEHVYIGKRLDLEIVFEFENIYGHRFEEVFEINFPLMENFDTMLRKCNFNSN